MIIMKTTTAMIVPMVVTVVETYEKKIIMTMTKVVVILKITGMRVRILLLIK